MDIKKSLGIGPRTRKNILKGKNIRKLEDGGDVFEDYWTDCDSDSEQSSIATESNLNADLNTDLSIVVDEQQETFVIPNSQKEFSKLNARESLNDVCLSKTGINKTSLFLKEVSEIPPCIPKKSITATKTKNAAQMEEIIPHYDEVDLQIMQMCREKDSFNDKSGTSQTRQKNLNNSNASTRSSKHNHEKSNSNGRTKSIVESANEDVDEYDLELLAKRLGKAPSSSKISPRKHISNKNKNRSNFIKNTEPVALKKVSIAHAYTKKQLSNVRGRKKLASSDNSNILAQKNDSEINEKFCLEKSFVSNPAEKEKSYSYASPNKNAVNKVKNHSHEKPSDSSKHIHVGATKRNDKCVTPKKLKLQSHGVKRSTDSSSNKHTQNNSSSRLKYLQNSFQEEDLEPVNGKADQLSNVSPEKNTFIISSKITSSSRLEATYDSSKHNHEIVTKMNENATPKQQHSGSDIVFKKKSSSVSPNKRTHNVSDKTTTGSNTSFASEKENCESDIPIQKAKRKLNLAHISPIKASSNEDSKGRKTTDESDVASKRKLAGVSSIISPIVDNKTATENDKNSSSREISFEESNNAVKGLKRKLCLSRNNPNVDIEKEKAIESDIANKKIHVFANKHITNTKHKVDNSFSQIDSKKHKRNEDADEIHPLNAEDTSENLHTSVAEDDFSVQKQKSKIKKNQRLVSDNEIHNTEDASEDLNRSGSEVIFPVQKQKSKITKNQRVVSESENDIHNTEDASENLNTPGSEDDFSVQKQKSKVGVKKNQRVVSDNEIHNTEDASEDLNTSGSEDVFPVQKQKNKNNNNQRVVSESENEIHDTADASENLHISVKDYPSAQKRKGKIASKKKKIVVNESDNEIHPDTEDASENLHIPAAKDDLSLQKQKSTKSRSTKPALKSKSTEGIRKSSRQRYAPLAHWRNERLLYRFENNGINILGIDKGTNEDDGPIKSLFKSQKGKKIQKELPKPKRAKLVDTEEGEILSADVLKRFSHIPWNITDEKKAKHQPYLIKRMFETNKTAFGFIQINVDKEKHRQYMPEEDVQLTVVRGKLELTIQKNNYKITEKDMFIVPRGCSYSIKNVGKQNALLSFVVGKFKFLENQTD